MTNHEINPRDVVRSILIPHKAFQDGLTRIHEELSFPNTTDEFIGFCISGDPGAGKSFFLGVIKDEHPSVHLPDGWNRPLVALSVEPSGAPMSGLGATILTELDPCASTKLNEGDLSRRIRRLMKGCGTIILMIDEWQQVADYRTKRTVYHAGDFLKIIGDERKLFIFLSCLPRGEDSIYRNKQFERRFRAPIRLPRFDWEIPELRNEFASCVDAFYRGLKDYMSLPPIYQDDWLYRLWCTTGGLIGYLAKFLELLLMKSLLREPKGELGLEDFAVVDRQYKCEVKNAETILKPFDRKFSLIPTLDVLTAARLIGYESEMPAAPVGNSQRITVKRGK
jgi:hypothetical protein